MESGKDDVVIGKAGKTGNGVSNIDEGVSIDNAHAREASVPVVPVGRDPGAGAAGKTHARRCNFSRRVPTS